VKSSTMEKVFTGLRATLTRPRSSLSWILRGNAAKDPIFVSQTYWHSGTLPRRALAAVLPGIERVDVCLPRVFDRKTGTSLSAEEACHLAAVTQFIAARKVLEIGTYDGNATLVLAANLRAEGKVVSVDLPPDFKPEQQESLTHSDVELNLTARDQLGRQFRGHPLSSHIQQVYGDSGALDWSSFGGPFDLIFIDGCHSDPYVRSDSKNAMEQLAPGGVILWHDYGSYPEVSQVVDELGHRWKSFEISAIEGTRLALGIKRPSSH
jgi:predicted O-methyltransferase YrrM